MRKSICALAIAASLSACVQPNTVVADGKSFPAAPVQVVSPPKGSPSVGANIPTVAQVSEIFNAVCVDTLPNFAGAGAALAKFGMRINPSTGVFLNPKLDLSVAIVQAGKSTNCSIIFATDQDAKKTADQLSLYGVSKKKSFFVSVIGTTPDRTYLNAQIAAQ